MIEYGHNDEIRSHESIFMIMIFMYMYTQRQGSVVVLRFKL